MKAAALARDLKALKRGKKSGYVERLELSRGRFVECHSPEHERWWYQFAEALNRGQLRTDEFSVADLFESLVENGAELRRAFNPKHGPSNILSEAAGAITSSDFSSITGQIVYNRLIEQLKPEQYPFQQMIPTQSTEFSGEKIAGIAGLGDMAEIVTESHEFPLVGVNQDYIETPATYKRGFIVPITKEAIFFDRTGQLLNQAGKVGDSLILNKEKRAIDCVIDENTTTHRYKWLGTTYATYQTTSPWDNVTASNALVDWTDIDNANQTLNGIVDPFTGEPVVVEADTLICTKQLEETAKRINMASEIVVVTPGYATSGNPTETKSPNPMAGKYKVMSTRLLASRLATDTDWFYGSPSNAFVYMQNWPITVTQAPAGNQDDFHRDIVTKFKASERGQYATIQPRYMSKATVA